MMSSRSALATVAHSALVQLSWAATIAGGAACVACTGATQPTRPAAVDVSLPSQTPPLASASAPVPESGPAATAEGLPVRKQFSKTDFLDLLGMTA